MQQLIQLRPLVRGGMFSKHYAVAGARKCCQFRWRTDTLAPRDMLKDCKRQTIVIIRRGELDRRHCIVYSVTTKVRPRVRLGHLNHVRQRTAQIARTCLSGSGQTLHTHNVQHEEQMQPCPMLCVV